MIMPKFTPQIILINIAVALHITVFTWLGLNYLTNELKRDETHIVTCYVQEHCLFSLLEYNYDYSCIRTYGANQPTSPWMKAHDLGFTDEECSKNKVPRDTQDYTVLSDR